MEKLTNTEMIYNVLDKGTEIIQKKLDILYLDALSEMGEIIFQGDVSEQLLSEKRTILEIIEEIPSQDSITKEEYRRAMQLAILKGMKQATQPHHAMTPDAVSLFVGYLVNKVLSYEEQDKTAVILDPALGSGNLLTAVMNQTSNKVHGIGAEPDETLLRLSYVNANLQKHSVDLFHQDSVATPLIKNVDAIVSDLPVGFYPNDDIAAQFELKAENGHSFVHHLIIEQALKHIKPGGFVFLLVPNFLFNSEQATQLNDYIKKEGIIYSFMQLPKTMFKNDAWGKSILILRKQTEGIVGPKQALLVELPSFSNDKALSDMMKRISNWFDDHLGK